MDNVLGRLIITLMEILMTLHLNRHSFVYTCKPIFTYSNYYSNYTSLKPRLYIGLFLLNVVKVKESNEAQIHAFHIFILGKAPKHPLLCPLPR